MPAPLLILLLADTVAFTWVDGIKIVLIPVLLFIMNRTFSRRDKSSDEERAKKNAEAKEREKRIDDEIRHLKEQVVQFVGEETLDKRFAKLEATQATQDKRQEGFQGAMEKMADTLSPRISSLESQMGELGKIREDMTRISTELKYYGEGINKLENKLDKLFDEIRRKS